MSTEASYSLQQSLYSLYRKYYHSGCVVLLNSKDFAHGTVRLTKPALYVVCEDVLFNPPASHLVSKPEYSTNNAYSMGFFAALTVETDGVVIDLQGHTIRQSYEHYARQRFFSVIELANSPFVPGQGPGSVRVGPEYGYKAATNCLIINGTLGLSSHSGVHGNNNANIMMQNVCVQDFESAGVQLNGVDTAFMDCVTVKGLACAPLTAHTFSLLQQQQILEQMDVDEEGLAEISIMNAAGGVCATLERLALCTALEDLVCLLLGPFIAADEADASAATPRTVTQALTTICDTLQQLNDDSPVTCSATCSTPLSTGSGTPIVLGVERFVQQPDSTGSPAPDGSAMYGMLFNSTGIAVGELSAVCPANGGSCCAHAPNGGNGGNGANGNSGSSGGYTSSCCRPSKSVTVHNCSISGLRLNARESVGVQIDGKWRRDITGKIIELIEDRTQGGTLLDYVQVYVNQERVTSTTWETCIQRYLVCSAADYSIDEFTTECTTHSFVYNVDVMAHVSKGIFGIRAEDTHGLCIENTTIKSLHNTSTTTCPRVKLHLPSTANVVSSIKRELDSTTDTAYGGADVRGVFVGRCEGVLMTKLTLDHLNTHHGMCRGVEMDTTHTGCVHALSANGLEGIATTAVHVHHNCSKLTMRELSSKDVQPSQAAIETLLEEIHAKRQERDANPNDASKQKAEQEAVCRLLRLPFADTQLLAFESPAQTGEIKLC